MVVAHVLSSLRIGGQERVALELASGQVGAGHEVMVVSLASGPEGPLANAFRQRGVSVHTVGKRPGVDLSLSWRLAALFRGKRATVVHTHNRMPLIYAAAAGKLAGARLVHTRHGPGRGSRRERWLRRGAGRFLDAYVAVSPELGDLTLALRDCPPSKLVVIENGIDLDRFSARPDERRGARQEFGIPEQAWVVGTVGRLAPEKDFPLLVRAAASVLSPDGRLVIVGDGAEAATIRAEIATQGVDPLVILPGARDDVPRWLAAMDVFALSSRMEGLPLCALEAMAAGLPVVAPAIGGLPGLIEHGVTGFLFPAGDEQALRARLLVLRTDAPLGRAVGERGRIRVREHHSREAMVRRYLDLYASLGARS